MNTGPVTVAIVQQPPAVLDLAASLRRASRYIGEAAADGARLVVFPETWLSGYPAWAFGLAGWHDEEARSWHAELVNQSVNIAADNSPDDLGPLRTAAAEHSVTVVMGLNERATPASGTLYNTLVSIGPDGTLLNVHRKLTPTHTERIVWAAGDGAGLRVVDTPAGRVGGLICWEHWNPLARQALHEQDELLHVAAWPDTPPMHHVAAQSYAFEGRCFVLCAGQYLTTDDVPAQLLPAYRKGVGPDAPESGILFNGGSGIVRPNGQWLHPPVTGRPETLIATIDPTEAIAYRHDLDVSCHYARTDVFSLTVDRRRRRTVSWLDH